MAKTILFAAALLLLGALIGNQAARYAATRHQPARAVMLLTQFHFDRLAAAVKSGRCSAVSEEREHLLRMYAEIIGAFPKTYASDAQFRIRADSLSEAVRAEPASADQCSSAVVKGIDAACESCHRDYR